jgi:hypothetical protein
MQQKWRGPKSSFRLQCQLEGCANPMSVGQDWWRLGRVWNETCIGRHILVLRQRSVHVVERIATLNSSQGGA